MPTVDLDAAVGQVFEAIKHHNTNDPWSSVNQVAADMASGEGLFENSDLDDGAEMRIYAAVQKLGNSMQNKLLALKAYNQGQFDYSVKGIVTNDTVILSKTLHPNNTRS